MTLKIKRAYFSIFGSGFEKFFGSHIKNYIGKLKMKGTDLTQTVEMNELFSPAGLASQVVW